MVMVAKGQAQDASHHTTASTIIVAQGTSRSGLKSIAETRQ